MAGLFGQLDKIERPKEIKKGGLFGQLAPTAPIEPVEPTITKPEVRPLEEKPGIERFAIGALQPFEKIGIAAEGRQMVAGVSEAIQRAAKEKTDFDVSLAKRLAEEKKQKEEAFIRGEEAKPGITPFKVGRTVGELGKFAIPYGVAGGAIAKLAAPLAAKAGTVAGKFLPGAVAKVVPILTVEGAKDLVIATPIDLSEGLQAGLRGKELAKHMGERAIFNFIANGVMLGGQKLLKSSALRKATTEQVDEITRQVARQTELPEGTIRQNIEDVAAREIEVPAIEAGPLLRDIPVGPLRPTVEPAPALRPTVEPIIPKAPEVPIGPLRPAIEPAVPRAPEISVEPIIPARPIIEPTVQRAPTVDIDAGLKPTKFTQTALKSDATGTELQRLIDENPSYYKPTTEIARQQVAKEIIDNNELAAIALVKDGAEFKSDVESAIGLELVPKLQNQGRFDEALDIIQAISRKGSRAGQFVQQMSAWSKSTPEGMLKWADKTLTKEGVKLDEITANNINTFMKNVNEVNVDGMKQSLLDAGLKVKNVEDMQLDRLKALNIALAQKQVIDKLPITFARKISTYQAISHLLNAKTMGRNLFGNTTFALAENLSKVYGHGFDKLISSRTGVKTTSLPTFVRPYKEAVKRFKEAGEEITLGVELGQGKYDLFRGKTFKKGVLGKAETMLSRGLKQPDEAFKGFIESQSIYSQVKSRIGKDANNMTIEQLKKQATPAELIQAQDEALYATFQDNSLPAQMLQGAKDVANKTGALLKFIGLEKVGGKEIIGPSGLKTREFGLGDFLIKYTKVPGNIISRGVEYTPAGYIKGLLTMNEAFKTGNRQLQRQAANAMGRATNGTSMIALATWLSSKGLIVSEDKDRSYNAKALDRAEGLGNYKLNVSALNRMLLGEEPTIQEGDELVSYNWNQPVATSLALGSSTYEQLNKLGATPQAASNILKRASEEILDLPTLYIIRQMFFEGMSADSTPLDIASVPLTQGASGFIPGPVRQLAQFTDPTFRETKGETQLRTALQKVMSGIPLVRERLEPRISPLGEEVKAKTGIFETFISPGIITEFKPSQVTPFLKKVEDLTGEDVIFPQPKAPKSVTKNKVKLPLTPKERTEYQKVFGASVKKQYSSLIPRVPKPENLSESQLESLVKTLEGIKRKARNEAKQTILRGR